MTLTYPDISGYQGSGIDLKGVPAACAKATEGTSFTSPAYAAQKATAARDGVFFFAYHFLHQLNGPAQAAHCIAVAGRTPLMLDFEPSPKAGSFPKPGDAVAFASEYRRLGGTCHLVYLPHWYWLQLGAPDLKPLRDLGMLLVSSAYPAGGYTGDHGSGWTPYGGMSPVIWQYASSQPLHGQKVDYNAYRGTLDQLKSLATTGKLPAGAPSGPPSSVLHLGSQGSDVTLLQERLSASGLRGVRGITVDGVFGGQTEQAVREFQSLEGLAVDGIVGPETWAAVWALKAA